MSQHAIRLTLHRLEDGWAVDTSQREWHGFEVLEASQRYPCYICAVVSDPHRDGLSCLSRRG
jgi:hypothetical protein